MNHADAAEIRAAVNSLECVEGPDDDRMTNVPLRLARVVQPGYLNGDPIYEVVVSTTASRRSGTDSVHLPGAFLAVVADRECYLRVDGDEIHIRDWRGGTDP